MEHGAKPEKSGDAKPPVFTIRKDSGAAMNTSKGVVMQSTKSFITRGVLLVLVALLSLSSLAQTPGNFSEADSRASDVPTYISSVVYRFVQSDDAQDQDFISDFGETEHTSYQSRFFRAERHIIANTRNSILLSNDRASFTLNTPSRAVSNVLSVAGTALQTPLNSTATKLVQALTLLASREANVEFAYTAQVNRYSRFDSMISCHFHNTDASKLDVVARIQYRIDF
jgi:hypothetical protein